MKRSESMHLPCSTKFKILSFFLMYVLLLASPFGLQDTGYNFARATLAGAVIILVTTPIWKKVLQAECRSGSIATELNDSEEYASI